MSQSTNDPTAPRVVGGGEAKCSACHHRARDHGKDGCFVYVDSAYTTTNSRPCGCSRSRAAILAAVLPEEGTTPTKRAPDGREYVDMIAVVGNAIARHAGAAPREDAHTCERGRATRQDREYPCVACVDELVINAQNERELHNAWRKRAEEAEAELARRAGSLRETGAGRGEALTLDEASDADVCEVAADVLMGHRKGWPIRWPLSGIYMRLHHAAKRLAASPGGGGGEGCPCTLVEPCSPNCSCANSVMSGGCQRCARYGSPEQRLAAARFIASRLTRSPRAAGEPTPEQPTMIPDYGVEADGTDAAHPAWWRGNDRGVEAVCERLEAILSGEHRGPFAFGSDRLTALAERLVKFTPAAPPPEGAP